MVQLAVQFADVEDAARLLEGVVHRTPIFTSRTFDARTGSRTFFKGEHLQRTGAFKIRGAYNAMARLSAEEKARGVLTYSSGNHAQAVALAGRLLGIRTVIVMPYNAPKVKRQATEAYGAEIVFYDPQEITREELGCRIAEERGLVLIPPYDHPHVVAGQGTVAYELLLHQMADLDMLLAPVGGGGLLSGCALTAQHIRPSLKVIGVEPALADDAARSFRTRTLHTVHNPPTVADGARTPSLGKVTFPLVLRHVDDVVTVPEGAIVEAMHFLWQRMKLVVEPTGALAAAGLLSGAVKARGKRVGVIISGGNVDLPLAMELFKEYDLEDADP